MRTIAVSDIHGHNRTFNNLLHKIGFTKNDRLVIIGDAIDRGPDSKGVLDSIIALKEQGYTVAHVMGNHERMMLDVYDDPGRRYLWSMNGSAKTLASFGVSREEDIPEKYIAYLLSLDIKYVTNEAIFVHAGLNTFNDDIFMDEHFMLWNRYEWYSTIDQTKLNGKVIIHGHTPTPRYKIEQLLKKLDTNRVMCIDNGCYLNRDGYHHLCALDITNRVLWFEENVG
jgi:serine/threonine protein phosphatase 1